MATITLKGIPSQLHRALKRRAKDNHRSLNQEVMSTLASATPRTSKDVEAILEAARKIRERLHFVATPEEIDAAKREGRA